MNDFLQEVREQAKRVGEQNITLAKKNGMKFYIGKLSISDGVQHLGYSYDSKVIQDCLSRYQHDDYGEDQYPEDIETNERAIASGYGDVMGEYIIDGHKIWIQTNLCEDTMTTIFLPEEWQEGGLL